MAQYTKQLHFLRNGTQNDIKLYTSLSDVVDASLINADGTTGGITLYTSTSDVEYPYLRLMEGDTPVYAALEELAANTIIGTDLKVSAGGKTYVVKKDVFPTPAEIKKILNAGKHTEYFNVGDSFPIKLNGTVGIQTFNNETYYATILGFDHNKELESNGKDSIHFIVGKNANGVDTAFCDSKYNTSADNAAAFHMNMTNTNAGGWNGSYMRNTICQQFKAALPSNLRSVLSSITKYSDNTGGGSDAASYVTATTDDIFLLSEYEVLGAKFRANSAEQNKQKQYAYYANGASKLRYKHSDASSAVWWRLRSAHSGNGSSFCCVHANGGATDVAAFNSGGFVPAFAIVAD